MSKKMMRIEPLTQVSKTDVSKAESELNELGKCGFELKSVAVSGKDNRQAYAAGLVTPQKWEYKILSFVVKTPKPAERTLNVWGVDGWELVCHYAQGVASWSEVAVLKRPVVTRTGSAILAEPFLLDAANAAQTPDPLEADRQDPPRNDIGYVNVVPKALEAAIV